MYLSKKAFVKLGLSQNYIRNKLNPAGGIGEFKDASIPRAKTRRVSTGSMTPSSQILADE